MNKTNRLYEPHLAVREVSMPPKAEWQPSSFGWSCIQVKSGIGYWLRAQASTELDAGTVLTVVAGDSQGYVRASQLNGLSLYAFNVIPPRLAGLITLGEQESLKQAMSRQELAVQIFPPASLIAVKMRELCASPNRDGLQFRLGLLQLFAGAFGKELEQTIQSQEFADAKERLRVYLKETPPQALLEINISELAEVTHCTPRHLNRIFYDLVGMSFRDKRAEIRLARARELLATSDSKVVDVALESGFKSLSLFNLMFARRFGLSPGRWRQKNAGIAGNENHRSDKPRRLAIV